MLETCSRPLSPTFEANPTNYNKTIMNMPNKNTNNTNRRRVHFSNDENDSQSASHQELTLEMISDMWYTPKHIEYFKQLAKYVILNKDKLDSQDAEFPISGLERYGPKRNEYKRSALFYTLHAQSKKPQDAEFIRAVARRCTAWARWSATQQGFQDYCDVYDPLACLLQDPNASVDLLKAVNKANANAANNDATATAEEKRLREVEDDEPIQTKRQRVC